MTRLSDLSILLCLFIPLFLANTGCISEVSSQAQNSLNITSTTQTVSVSGSSKIIAISTGGTHNLALRENGTTLAWAEKSAWARQKYGISNCKSGECDVPVNLMNVTAIAAGPGFSAALTKEGNVVAWGCDWDHYPPHVPRCGDDCPCRVPANLTHVRSISAGRYCILAVREDGTVTGWGGNPYHSCDVPSDLKNVSTVYAGESMSMALKEDGGVSTWGWYEGSIPVGNYKGIAAGYRYGLLLTNDGTVRAFRSAQLRDYQYPTVPVYHPDLTNVTAISAGNNYFVALLENRTVVYWGVTKSLSLKPGENAKALHNITAISSQGLSNLALKDDGTVISWSFEY